MKYKTAIVGVTLGSLFAAQPILAQTPEIITNELVNLCVKFPLNSRCDVLEALMPLEERSGEEAGCNFVFDPQGTDGGSCKINVGKQKITIYQELGEELDALDGERTTVEINVSRDRIFATNFQIWNKIRRWEVGFLPEDNDSQHPSNFLVMLMGENSAESLMSEIDDLAESKPKLLTEVLAAGDYQTPEIERLLETKACEYCDLSNADLSGVDLKGANLLGANLQEADLTDANFEGVNLVFGNLARATLVGTDFKGANLQEANLELADLQEAELSAPSYLKGANLREANLTDANLRGANLQEANLTDANLEGATLDRTSIKLEEVPSNYDLGKQLIDTFIIGLPILRITSGSDKVKFNTNLNGANLERANLSYTSLNEVIFEGANLTEVDFSESSLDVEKLEEQEDAKLCDIILPDGSSSDRNCQ